MRNIKLVYEYDGSDFFGFQRQPDKRTIQGDIEQLLKKYLKEDVNLISSGRTDKGVHSTYQVSNFCTKTHIPTEKIKFILEKKLPKDILIREAEDVDMDFHSRFSAKTRTYTYVMKPFTEKNIFEIKYVTFVKGEIEVEKFLKILKPLEGRQDFSSFRKSGCDAKNPFRDVEKINFEKKDGKYILTIKANAFLKSMIRIILGSALAIYFKRRDEDYILQKLSNPDAEGEKILSDPQGLFLSYVDYEG